MGSGLAHPESRPGVQPFTTVIDGPFRDPGIPDGERTEYRPQVAGRLAGAGHLTIEAGARAYVQRVEAELDEGYALDLELAWARRHGTLLAESYALESRDGEHIVAREEGRFRDVRALGWGGALRAYPREITPLLGAAVALRGLEWERGERRTFALWLANTVWWEIEVHVERHESVTVPAGCFPAWRVAARPSFHAMGRALDRLVGALLPPFTLHFAAEGPHRLLRFSFPTGPFPWNPRGRIEATQLGKH